MKTILLVMTTLLMLTPAMAFDQQQLDQIEDFNQLQSVPEINMDGIAARNGGKKINDFFGKRRFECVAQNRGGRRFQAQGPNRMNVQRRAMRKCRINSRRPRTCRVVRCRREGGKFWDFIDLIDSLNN